MLKIPVTFEVAMLCAAGDAQCKSRELPLLIHAKHSANYLPAKRLVKKALVSHQVNERLLAASFKPGFLFRKLRIHLSLQQGWKKTSSTRHSALSFCSKYDMITKVILGRRRRAISEMQISVTVEPYITIVFRCLWLNFRISSHLFASRWVTNMPIFVICLVVEKVPTSGGVFWSWDLFPSVTIKSAKIKSGMYIWKS